MGNWYSVDKNHLKDKEYQAIGRIQSHIINLLDIVDINFDLYDKLRNLQVLTDSQLDLIRRKQTKRNQIAKLLSIITTLSSSRQLLFLDALKAAGQSHVVEFLLHDGKRPLERADNWPVWFSEHRTLINKHWDELVDIIDASNGLLDELLSNRVITLAEKRAIEAGKTATAVNQVLMMVMAMKSVRDYLTFVQCLKDTKACRAVSLLSPNVLRISHCVPLNRKHSESMQAKHALLVSVMDLRRGLLAEMLKVDCITWRQKMFVETAMTDMESKARLINMLVQGSESDFERFLYCLAKTGQRHLSRVILTDGVVTQLVVQSDSGSQNKRLITKNLMLLLNNGWDNSNSEPFLHAKTSEILCELKQKQAEIVSICADDKGTRVFILCKTVQGLQYLYENLSDYVEPIIQKLFCMLLQNDKRCVDSIEWNISDYYRCMAKLCSAENLPLLSLVYGKVANQQCSLTQCTDTAGFERLPLNIAEQILLKSTGQMFAAESNSAANMSSVVTVCAVSLTWWRIFYRLKVKQLAKRYFQRLCHPYSCTPKQISGPNVEGDRSVWGMAEWNGKLYIACDGSDTIQVFGNRPPFSRLESVKVEGLISPNDIAVCVETDHLFVVDSAQCVIWRVNLSSPNQIARFITQPCVTRSISTRARNLVVTPADGDALFICNVECEQLKDILLPHYMKATHAIQTSRNTYVVCHYKRSFVDSRPKHADGVSELNVNGMVLRQIRVVNQQHFNDPFYALTDGYNDVIVCDRVNERVVLFTDELKIKRVLLQAVQGQPYRMCLSKDDTAGFLFIARPRGENSVIGVFKIL